MKTLTLIIVLGLALGACSKSPRSGRGFVPIHTNLQIAIDKGGVGGCVVEPHLKDTKFDASSHVAYTCKRRDGDGPECSASIEYRGTESGKDYYLVTVMAPPGAVGVPAPAELAYAGREIEVWRDSTWLIRIRPKPGSEPNGAANRSQPVGSETNRVSAVAGSGR